MKSHPMTMRFYLITIINLIFAVLILSTPIFGVTGYVRYAEASFCMDSCSIYFLEDEYGEFLSWITHLDDMEMMNDYNDRFVDIEGDTIQCVECEAINVSSILISDECQMPVNCFAERPDMWVGQYPAVKRKEWIEDYFLQLAAYAMAHNHVYNTQITQGVILLCTKDNYFQRFITDGAKFVAYQHKFLARVGQYYKEKGKDVA